MSVFIVEKDDFYLVRVPFTTRQLNAHAFVVSQQKYRKSRILCLILRLCGDIRRMYVPLNIFDVAIWNMDQHNFLFFPHFLVSRSSIKYFKAANSSAVVFFCLKQTVACKALTQTSYQGDPNICSLKYQFFYGISGWLEKRNRLIHFLYNFWRVKSTQGAFLQKSVPHQFSSDCVLK